MARFFPSFSPHSAARVAVTRLLLVWLPLSALIGLLAWYAEQERLEARVLGDAVRDAKHVTAADLQAYYRGESDTTSLHTALKRVLGNIVSIEVYDLADAEIAQELNEHAALVPPEVWAHAEATPIEGHARYEQIVRDGRMFIITVVAVADAGGAAIGYLKSIYLVPADVLSEMREDSIGAVFVGLASALASLLVMFPIILLMQREHVRQARRILDGNLALLEVIGNAIAVRDSDTDSHNYRVTIYSLRLAEQVGLRPEQIRVLLVGAFLHDVGKIGIPDAILHKPDRLDDGEFAVMKTHVGIGSAIVRRSAWLTEAVNVVAYHHEKFDGTGYLEGLAGEAIPVEARVFALADVFDALTTKRPYKEAYSVDQALQIMRADSGTHFDPALFAAFEAAVDTLYREVALASHDAMRQMLQVSVRRYLTQE